MRQWTTKNYRTMPWKNGGGSTTELAIFPDDASLDDFVWRLSTATVSQAGPFSYFRQVDRTIVILSGDGLVLKRDPSLATQEIHTLQKSSQPYQFFGEDTVYAELISGNVVDLNMMSRCGVCQHYMQRLFAGEHYIQADDAQQILIYCAQGSAVLNAQTAMAVGDLILLDEENEQSGIQCQIQVEENAIVYAVRISFLNQVEHLGGSHVLG